MKVNRSLLRRALSGRALLAAAISCGLAGGALAAVQARWMSLAVAGVFLRGEGLAQVSPVLGALLVVMCLRAVFAWGMEYAAGSAAARIKARLRDELFSHILALGPAYTRRQRTGELTHVATEGIEALQAYFSLYLPQLALAALVPLVLLAFIFPLDALSALVLLLTAPLIPIFMVLIGSLADALTRRQWISLSRMSAAFLDALQGLTTLKAFGRAGEQARIIARLGERHRTATLRVLRVTFLSALSLELLSTLSTAIVAVEVGLRLLYGRLSFEQAFFVLLLAPEFYLPLRNLGGRFHAAMAGMAAADRLDEILSQPASPEAIFPPSEALNERSGSITAIPDNTLILEDVSFIYPGSPAPALSGVSFQVNPGQRVAIVGRSGAGKSTLASLLLRFMEPSGGRIRLGGEDVSACSIESWRRRVAWVPQRPHLFDGTLEANIRIARPDATQDEVVRAARLAHAHEFIESLPQGYATPTGERGARLSAGEVQRIALARAFLKDAPLLVLDEPTSHLDPEQETLVNVSLEKLVAGRSTLVIAHRLATAAGADRILVLDRGRLVEAGSHRELIEKGGVYRALVQAASPASPVVPTPGLEMDRPAYRPAGTFSEIGSGAAVESSHPPRSQAFHPLWRLMRLIAPYGGWIALSVLLGAATVGSGIGLMAVSAYLISAAALHPSIAALQVAIVGVRFFGLGRGVFRYLERLASHEVTFRVLGSLRLWFYQALEPLAPARLLSFRSGDLLGRALGDIAELENFYVRALAPPLVAVIVVMVTVVFMHTCSPAAAWALLAFLLAGGLGLPLCMGVLGRRTGKQSVQARGALYAFLVDNLQGMADLLAFDLARRRRDELADLSRSFETARLRLACLDGLQASLAGLLAHLGMLAVLVQAIRMVSAGQLAGVYLAVLVLSALACFEALLPLPQAAQSLGSQAAAARRLFELVDAQPEVGDPPRPAAPPASYELEVEGLSFVYPRSAAMQDQPGRSALDNLSFILPPAGRLAIVGPSGAGKTTLLHLLLRFWEYREGSIRLGGNELRSYGQEEVRRAFSLVSQNTDLFNATLRENLLLARPDATQEMLFQAARQAQIHDFILSLPQGYDTWVGEQGLRLSGGERQRLALARALLKDAPVLLLDEPSANLDALTERRFMDTLITSMEGRTTLLVTHRLVGMEAMQDILVMDRGRVVERGRHQELVDSGGLYARMWALQNRAFLDA